MTYDPSHRMPPRQQRWPAATPAEGWPSHRDGEQEDPRNGAPGATAGYRQQAVATAAYPGVANGYDWSRDGYGGTASGYAGPADAFDGAPDGYGRAGHGYASVDDGYASVNDGFASGDNGYDRGDNGYDQGHDGYDWPDAAYAGDTGGYDWSRNGHGGAHGYAGPDEGYTGGAYLGPGSYVEPGAVLTDNPVLTAPDAGIRPDRWQAEQERRREAARRGRMIGAVSEVLAIGVVLGVSTLAAGLLKSATSPVSAMGAMFIARTPAALRSAVLHHFGAHGRTVLLLGMYLTFAVVAIAIGMMARRDAVAGVGGVAAFSLFAAFVVITRPAGRVTDVMPVVIGGLAGVAAALWLFRASAPPEPHAAVRHGHGGARRRTR